MFRNTVPSRQLATWLSVALAPVLLQLCAGIGWAAALLTSVVCGVAVFTVWKWGGVATHPAIACLQYLYIIVLLWNLLPNTAMSWPGDNYPAVPLILLALAAWSVNKGADAAARVGCVLFWIVLIIYLAVIVSGVGSIKAAWLIPKPPKVHWKAATLLLIPGAAVVLNQSEQSRTPRLFLSGMVFVAGSVITAGILSPHYAAALPDPFYTAVRSLNVLGVARGFEAVLSACMTAGWFSLLSVLLSVAAAQLQQWGRGGVWLATGLSALGMLCKMYISWEIMALLASVFWVIIPLTTQGLVREKKS